MPISKVAVVAHVSDQLTSQNTFACIKYPKNRFKNTAARIISEHMNVSLLFGVYCLLKVLHC